MGKRGLLNQVFVDEIRRFHVISSVSPIGDMYIVCRSNFECKRKIRFAENPVDNQGVKELLQRMKASPVGWGEQDIKSVLVGHGFIYREGGKHTVYQHENHPELTISVPRHRDLRAWVARDVVKLIEQL